MDRPMPGFSMEDIKTDLGIEEFDSHALTLPEWAEALGVSRWKAAKLIKAKVKAGTWVKCVVRRENRPYAGYRPRLEEER